MGGSRSGIGLVFVVGLVGGRRRTRMGSGCCEEVVGVEGCWVGGWWDGCLFVVLFVFVFV